jgi:hypothetical protein
MTQEEIIQKVLEYLDQHLRGGRGYIGQEPYKGDFFALFKEAFRNGYFEVSPRPLLTGDAFRDVLVARWFTENEEDNEKRTRLMEQLFSRWDEWRYAWKHYDV